MRKLALTICIALMGFLSYGQEAKFYTDNGSREVTELELGMSDIKVVVPVPDEIRNHELVEVAIDYWVDGEVMDGNFRHVKEYKTSYLSTKDEVILWIKSPGSSEGDFCILDTEYCFGIEDPLKRMDRDFASSKVEVRVLGKDLSGYKWRGNQQVPTYKFTTLSSHYINMDYGELDAVVKSEDGKLKAKRYNGEQKISVIKSENELAIFYSSLGKIENFSETSTNSVVFLVRSMENDATPSAGGDMGAGGPPKKSEGSTVETLKKSVSYNFLYGSNSYDATRYVDGIAPSFGWYHNYNDDEDDVHFYEPLALSSQEKSDGNKFMKQLIGTSKEKLKQDYYNLAEEGAKKLDWKPGKIGNFDCEILDVQIYHKGQVFEEGEPEMMKVKPSEIGNTKRLLLFIGEKGNRVIYGFMFKGGGNPLTEDEQNFWDHMMANLEVE